MINLPKQRLNIRGQWRQHHRFIARLFFFFFWNSTKFRFKDTEMEFSLYLLLELLIRQQYRACKASKSKISLNLKMFICRIVEFGRLRNKILLHALIHTCVQYTVTRADIDTNVFEKLLLYTYIYL